MIIKPHPHFQKSYKKRISRNKTLAKKMYDRLILFRLDKTIPELKDHSLTGDMQGLRSFSVTGDIRIVYYQEDNTIWLYDIGTHNQIY